MKKIAFVFPGQGAQQKGMASDLMERFKDLTQLSSEILGLDIKKLILEDPLNQLSLTQFTQPVMYFANSLFYYAYSQDNPEIIPSYLAGHSLGEYNALLVAKSISYDIGLKLVKKRGELIADCGSGAMSAIIGLTQEQLENTLLELQLNLVEMANLNTPTQIVVSGDHEQIQKLSEFVKSQKGVLSVPLKVSGAFHSRYMKPAAEKFGEFLKGFTFLPPQIPVVANLTAQIYPINSSEIAKILEDQINHPVQWSKSVLQMHSFGVEEFKELGPGKILNGLINKILNSKL